MTRLFGKKNNNTTIAELEEYYANQNQRKTRPVRAWLMAILSLLITVAVIVALFFFGRWVYNTITNDENEPATTSSSETNGTNVVLPNFDGGFDESSASTNSSDVSGASNSTNSTDTNSNASSSSDSATSTDGVVSDQAASTSESNADRIASTGGSELPNTGAGELIIIAPIIAGIAGYSISRRKQLKD